MYDKIHYKLKTNKQTNKQKKPKRVWNALLGCNLKDDRMISVHFQGKTFNITVIQVYAPSTNAKEAEVEQVYDDLQDLLELTPEMMSLSLQGSWMQK